MKPGLYRNLTYEQYDAIDATRSTDLKRFEKSALHALYERQHQKDAAHFRVGRALHSLALEPEVPFEDEYAVAPKVDKRTKKGREEWAEFEAKSGHRALLTEQQHATVRGMLSALERHPEACELLHGTHGFNEATAVWSRSPGPGFAERLCKARIDRLCSWRGIPTVVDLKSTKDASPRAFERDLRQYGYHVSAGWYLGGLQTLAPAGRQFVILAVENTPPHAVAVYTLDDEYVSIGAKQGAEWFRRLAAAEETDTWTGYESKTLYPAEWLVNDWLDAEGDVF